MPSFNSHKNKKIFVITKISNELCGNIVDLLSDEKTNNTISRSKILFRKVSNGILYIIRTGYLCKMAPSEFGSGHTPYRRFQQ
jgi:transposase